MYYPNLYVMYNSWRDRKIEELDQKYDDDLITEDKYLEEVEKLNWDDFRDQYADRNEE